jgi:hypothetical protein
MPHILLLDDRITPVAGLSASLGVSVSPSNGYNPAAANLGDTLNYTAIITNPTGATATGVNYVGTPLDANTTLVAGSLHASPIANDDTYSWVANTTLDSSAKGLPTLFSNDTAPLGESIHLVSNTAPAHGSVTINPDGSFVYTPNANTLHFASDSFTYTINNNTSAAISGALSTATVTINFAGSVWYVDSAAAAGGTGTIASPFNTLAQASGADAAGDTIFLYKGTGTYTDSITLNANEKLIGQGTDLTFDTGFKIVTIVSAGSGNTPTIGNTVNLLNGDTLKGFDINSTTNNGLVATGTSGSHLAETISLVNVTTTTGVAVNFTYVDGVISFTSISAGTAATGPASGIILTHTTGSFTITGTGTANSGGVIQHTGSHGLNLTDVQNLVINRMSIHDTGDDGIFGDGVNNFTFRDSTIFNFGNGSPAGGVTEDAMDFESTNPLNTASGHGLTGTVIIQRDTFGPDGHFTLTTNPPPPENTGIIFRNHNDVPLNLVVTGTTFKQISNRGIDGDIVNGDGSLIVDGTTPDGTNTFSQINGAAVNFGDGTDDSAPHTLDLLIRNNNFQTVGNAARWIVSAEATVNARFINNTASGVTDNAIRSLADPSAPVSGHPAVVNAFVTGNNMGGGSALIESRRGATQNLVFGSSTAGQGNTNMGKTGILAQADAGAILNADFFNNSVSANGGSPDFASAALYLLASDNGGGGSTISAKITGNNFGINPVASGAAITLDDNGETTNKIFIEGWAGTPTDDPSTFLSGSNTLAGTPLVAVADHVFGNSPARNNLATPVTTLTTGSPLTSGQIGVPYSRTISATTDFTIGHAYNFSVVNSALPAGLTLSSGGVLSGTPTAAGNFSFTILAIDTTVASHPLATQAYSLTINAPSLTIGPGSLAGGTVGAPYSQTITASGGTSPYHFTISSGALPGGLFLNQDTGVISGVPTTASGSPFSFTVQATDSSTGTGPFSNTQNYTIAVSNPTVSLSNIPIGNLPIGAGNKSETIVYQAKIKSVLDSPANATTFTTQGTVTSSVPGGTVLTDDPNIVGTANPTVVNLLIPPSVTTQPSDAATDVGFNATFTAHATGYPTPTVKWQQDTGSGFGDLSNGTVSGVTYSNVTTDTLTITGATLAINGSHYRAVFTNGVGTDATSNAATLTVNPVPTFTPSSLTTHAIVSQPYSAVITVSDGTPPYTISAQNVVANGTGLTTASFTPGPTTISLSFTPTGTGTASFTINAIDAANSAGFNHSYTVVVDANSPPVVTNTSTLAYTENDPPTQITNNATVSDSDSPDFNGGSLTVSFTANGTTDDQLTIQNQGTGPGQIGLSGSNVTYGGATMGTFSGGTNGTNLVVSFNSAVANATSAQALIRAILYSNSSDSPSTAPRTVTFAVNDGDGGTGSATATINVTAVNDVPTSTISATTVPPSPKEGTIVTVNGTVTDLDGSTDTMTVTWAVTGPHGFSTASTPSPFAGSATGAGTSISFTPTDDGIYTVTLNAHDTAGATASLAVQTVSVANVAPTPTIVAISPAPRNEGTAIAVTAAATDPAGTNDTTTFDYTVTAVGLTAPTNSFSVSGSTTGATFTFLPPDNGSYTIVLTAHDEDGGTFSPALTTIVSVADVAPTPTITAIAPRNEGTAVGVTATATDPAGANDTTTFDYTVTAAGLSAPTTSFSVSGSQTGSTILFTPPDNGNYTIVLTAHDEDGSTFSPALTTVVTVADVAPTPTITAINPSTRNEGTAVFVTATATDPAGANDTTTFDYIVTAAGLTAPTSSFSVSGSTTGSTFSFLPPDNGSYTIVLAAHDEDGGTFSPALTTIVSVADVAPTPTIVAISPAPRNEGAAVAVTAAATDPAGANDTTTFDYTVTAAGLTAPASTFSVSGSAPRWRRTPRS